MVLLKLDGYGQSLKPLLMTFVKDVWTLNRNTSNVRRNYVPQTSLTTLTMVGGEKQGPYSLNEASWD
jgi:hypothetical protein